MLIFQTVIFLIGTIILIGCLMHLLVIATITFELIDSTVRFVRQLRNLPKYLADFVSNFLDSNTPADLARLMQFIGKVGYTLLFGTIGAVSSTIHVALKEAPTWVLLFLPIVFWVIYKLVCCGLKILKKVAVYTLNLLEYTKDESAKYVVTEKLRPLLEKIGRDDVYQKIVKFRKG